MTKFRTHGPDVHPGAVRKVAKPGIIPSGKIPIYDHDPAGKLRLRGVVGPTAPSSVAARFHGKLGSTIGVVGGRKCWIAPKQAATSKAPAANNARVATSIKTDRGSVSSKGKR